MVDVARSEFGERGLGRSRQRLMALYLSSSALTSRVIAWSTYDGNVAERCETGEEFEPPYSTGVDALRDGWRLVSAAPLLPAEVGTEYSTSFLKFEFWFERLEPAAERPGSGRRGGVGAAASVSAVGPSGLLGTEEMARFVSRGFLVFDGLIPEDLNGPAAREIREEEGLRQRSAYGARLRDCFVGFPGVRAVLEWPPVLGIIESMVGPEPVYDHHAVHVRRPGEPSQELHADSIIDLRAAFDVQLMYYPEEVGPASGGTLLVPGSHFRRVNERDIGRYQNVLGQIGLQCSAGTVVVVHHGIWHCGRRNRADRVRYMFKLRLAAAVPQVRRWDASDLGQPGVEAKVQKILAEPQPWFEDAAARLEQVQRAALWRRLSGDDTFDAGWRWHDRLANQGVPRLLDLLP